jgi:ABC-type nitrate/sulfonate/bicarbonate transport system ATPase subunit
MTDAAASIEIRDLYKIFGKTPGRFVDAVRGGMSKAELGREHGHILGLNNINISMPAGRIQVIMGLSGSGKSTLIRHINRLIEPTAGQVIIDGQDVLRMTEAELKQFRRSKTAMVFQKFALLPHRTVIDNVTFGLEVRGLEAAKARATGMHWIERVGLAGFEERYPNELSGGMQQRVGLARALSNDASILLMDEAYSALDPLIRTDMQAMLLELQQEIRKTVVFITHDLDEAVRLMFAAPEGRSADAAVELHADPAGRSGLALDLVILGVKPQIFGQLDGRLTARLAEGIGHSRVIRVMPNLPVMVGVGMSLGRFDRAADEEEFERATPVFSCGPGFVLAFAEQMVQAATASGVPAGLADRLVRQTFLGAARMLAETISRRRNGSPGSAISEQICLTSHEER